MPNQYYSCFASTTVPYLPYLSNVPSTLNTRYHQKYCPFCLFSCSTLLSARWSNCGKRWKRNQMLQNTGKGIVSFSTVQCCASTTVFLSQFVELPKSLDGFPLPWDSLLPKNSTQEFLLHLPKKKRTTHKKVYRLGLRNATTVNRNFWANSKHIANRPSYCLGRDKSNEFVHRWLVLKKLGCCAAEVGSSCDLARSISSSVGACCNEPRHCVPNPNARPLLFDTAILWHLFYSASFASLPSLVWLQSPA